MKRTLREGSHKKYSRLELSVALPIPARNVEQIGFVVILHQLDDDANVARIILDRDHAHDVCLNQEQYHNMYIRVTPTASSASGSELYLLANTRQASASSTFIRLRSIESMTVPVKNSTLVKWRLKRPSSSRSGGTLKIRATTA